MNTVKLFTNDIKSRAYELTAGQRVLLNGTVYTARDAAHKRIKALLDSGQPPPFPIDGAVIYYAGPTPAPDGMVCGSIGPTTSGRMDVFTPELLDLGLAAMIGKGGRSDEVTEAIVRNSSVYFAAAGGAGVLYASCVRSLEIAAFEDLGCESVKRLVVENFPVVVAIDAQGQNIIRW